MNNPLLQQAQIEQPGLAHKLAYTFLDPLLRAAGTAFLVDCIVRHIILKPFNISQDPNKDAFPFTLAALLFEQTGINNTLRQVSQGLFGSMKKTLAGVSTRLNKFGEDLKNMSSQPELDFKHSRKLRV